jgi:hypothetical protein
MLKDRYKTRKEQKTPAMTPHEKPAATHAKQASRMGEGPKRRKPSMILRMTWRKLWAGC